MVVQTDLPHKQVRSNSLEVCGDMMVVAYQTAKPGLNPAGIELFDISKPETPKSITLFDCSGPHSRGVHQLWFVDGQYIDFSGGAADFAPVNPLDDQFYRIIDVKDPAKPREAGRWWIPRNAQGRRRTAAAAPSQIRFRHAGAQHQRLSRPARPRLHRLDRRRRLDPRHRRHGAPQAGRALEPHPPFPGFTHTAMPLFDRGLLMVSDECVRDEGADWPKLVWILDMRREDNLVPIATLPLPPVEHSALRRALRRAQYALRTVPARPSAPRR